MKRAGKIALLILAVLAAGWVLLLVLSFIVSGVADDSAADWLLVVVLPVVLLVASVWGYQRIEVTKGRPCPRCAADVPKGVVICPSCGFDFGTLVSPQPTAPSGQPPQGT